MCVPRCCPVFAQRRCGIPRYGSPNLVYSKAQQQVYSSGSEYTCHRPGRSRLDCSQRLELYSLQAGVEEDMGNGASHWEATDQSGLVRSWEGATGEVGLCPSAASLETQGLNFWREPGHWSSSGGFCQTSSFLPPPG